MRILFLTGALCFAGAQSAFAVKTPSEDEVKEIREQMFVGNRMTAQIDKVNLKLYRAKAAKAGDAEIIGLEMSLAREIDKQNVARTKAMHMAILAYGLEPANWSGTSVMPKTKGRTIKWLPRVRQSEDHALRVGGEVLGTVKKDKTGYVGITYMDGVTIMDASAFEKGPGYLASYILHERIHFEQFTTHGKGNAISYAEAQEAAYQAQVDNAEHFFDPKVPAELRIMQDIEIARDSEKDKAVLEKKESGTILGRLRGLLPRSSPPDYFDAKIHTNAELADISGLVAQARGQAEIARREREVREQNARGDAEYRKYEQALSESRREQAIAAEAQEVLRQSQRQTPVAAHIPPSPLSAGLPELKYFAMAACRGPEQAVIGRFLSRPYDLSNREYDDNQAKVLAADLGDCPKRLFLTLIEMIRVGDWRRTDRQWIRGAVAAYSRAAETVSDGAPPAATPRKDYPCEIIDGIRVCDFGPVR